MGFDNEIILAMEVYSMFDNDIKPIVNTNANVMYQSYYLKEKLNQLIYVTLKNEIQAEKLPLTLIIQV
jgi:hypothetical protein